MELNENDLKYKDVIKTLKSLPQVKVPSNFEADLMRRINSERFEEKQSFWEKIFLPSRLIPSAGLAVAAVLLLFVINLNSDETENPLLMEPKVRKDIIEAKKLSDIPLSVEEKSEQNRMGYGSESSGRERTQRSQNNGFTTAGFSIEKEGLNFRQMNLSEEEKKQLNELRKHFRKLLEQRGNN